MSVSRTVTLHGIRVPLRTELSDTDLDAAVLKVRECMDQVSRGAAHREPAIVAALAALNLAGDLLRRQDGPGAETGALDVLSKRIEQHLDQTEAAGG
jgi:hypothetical protein